jgi:hypothetical protein
MRAGHLGLKFPGTIDYLRSRSCTCLRDQLPVAGEVRAAQSARKNPAGEALDVNLSHEALSQERLGLDNNACPAALWIPRIEVYSTP